MPDELSLEASIGEAMESAAKDIDFSSTEDVDPAPEPERKDAPTSGEGKEKKTSPAPTTTTTTTPASGPRAAPKSWAVEHHESWAKLDPKVQEYIELREKQMGEGVESFRGEAEYGRTLKKTIEPFLPDIQAMGATEAQAIQYLMGAHQMLQRGTAEQRGALFLKLARDYGVDVKALAGAAGDAPAPNPEVVELRQQLQGLTRTLTAQQHQEFEARRATVMKDVQTFFADPKHPYAAEVADHIVLLLQNPNNTLESAYEQAVWANPATRAKEQARLQEESERALREKAEKEAAEAEKARGTRVRGQQERSATEPLGSIDDTMRDTYKKVMSR